MAATITDADGFEHQTLTQLGNGIWSSALSGAVTIDTTVFRSGVASLKVAQDGATQASHEKLIRTAAQTMVGAFYFRVAAAPSVTSTMFAAKGPTAAGKHTFAILTTGVIQAQNSGAQVANGPNIADGLWHKLDFRFVSTTTYTIEWYVDGVEQSSTSLGGQTALNMTNWQFGALNATHTLTVNFDDFICSNTSADYPLAPVTFGEIADGYQVRWIVPNNDGNHNAGTNVMERQSDGVDIGVTTAWDLLDEWPAVTTTSDTINQAIPGTGNYFEVQFQPTKALLDQTVWGAVGYLAYSSVGTPANTAGTIMSNDAFATQTTIYGVAGALADYSDTAIQYKTAVIAIPAGGWTKALINSMKCRGGYSDDATPDPLWNAVGIAYVTTDMGRGRPSPAQVRQAVKRASVF